MTSPSGTGYEDRLYSIRGAQPDVADVVEKRFFQVMDDQAARALERLETSGPVGDWSISERSAWTRFLLSLALRAPSDVAALRDHWDATFTEPDADAERAYRAQRSETDPLTFRERLKAMPPDQSDPYLFDAYVDMIDNLRVGRRINDMFWAVADTRNAKFELLTSDRPVIRQPLNDENGHIALPIGPHKLFMASTNKAANDRFKNLSVNDLVSQVNRLVVEHAEKLVFGSTDVQLRFVSNRLGADRQPGLLRVRAKSPPP